MATVSACTGEGAGTGGAGRARAVWWERTKPDLMVGRDQELARFEGLIAAVMAGSGGVAWIQGEPGVGTSALVAAVLTMADEAGCQVLHGAGDELSRSFPLRLMADCLGVMTASEHDSLAAEIRGLLRGDLAGPGTSDPVLVASERMLELVDRRCADRPLALAVEDLHWSDDPSLLVWGRLAQAVDQIPLLLIGTARATPQRNLVARRRHQVAARSGTVIDLGPLRSADVMTLGSSIAGGAIGPRLRAALNRTGGNPLYVRELVGALIREGQVAVSGDTAEMVADAAVLPGSLTVAVASRLGLLAEETQEILRVAALLGNEFDVGDLAAISRTPVLRLVRVIGEATASGVISETGDRLRFRHDLIREVLAEQTPAPLRFALHAEIAHELADSGGGIEAVAKHLLASSAKPDGWVLDWLISVGESAAFMLPRVFAELLERAVSSAGPGDPRWQQLSSWLALVRFWLGRDAQARQVAMAVIERTDDLVLAARMRVLVLRSSTREGRPDQGLAVVAGSPADDQLPAAWRARLSTWSARVLCAVGQTAAASAAVSEGLDLAKSSGDPLSVAYAHYVASMSGSGTAALNHLTTALSVLTSQDPESADLKILLMNALIALFEESGDTEAAEETLARALPLAEQAGAIRRALILTSAANLRYLHGRWEEALSCLGDVGEEFSDNGDFGYHHSRIALLALRRGDRETADPHLQAAIAADPAVFAVPAIPADPLTQALALRAEADGDLPQALALMMTWMSARGGQGRNERHDDAMPHLVRLALAAGDRDTAEAAARISEEDAEGGALRRVLAARLCRAMMSGDAGESLAVAQACHDHGWRPAEAAALEEAAACLGAAGDIAGARAAHTQAVLIRTLLGASWEIRRADARLRTYGVRRGPRSTHRRAPTGWDALTPSEARIARLVARGMSNPDIAAELFLSRRTVQAHVSSILTKLQVRSRLDVARLVAGGAAPFSG